MSKIEGQTNSCPERKISQLWGHATPPVIATSANLEQQLSLDSGWIERRTGIRSRRYADSKQATSDLAIEAVRNALPTLTWNRPGLLLLATSTPDHLLPPTAPLVAERAGLTGWGAIDLAGACCGFIYALALGQSFAIAQKIPVAVVAANVLSRRLKPTDTSTRAIFADGAGAMVIPPDAIPELVVDLGSDGRQYEQVIVPAGGSRLPLTMPSLLRGEQHMQMARGPDVFRRAVDAMVERAHVVLDRAGLGIEQVDWWVPHQANRRLMVEVGRRLGIDGNHTVSIIEEWGNSSAASIPTAISIAIQDGRIQPGQRLLLTAAGAGMVSAAAILTV